MAHAALNWHAAIADRSRPDIKFFGEFELGGAVHNGYPSSPPPGFRDVGCQALFYYGFNLGVELNPVDSVMVSLQHGSHFGLCGRDHNEGINYFGLRYGHKLN